MKILIDIKHIPHINFFKYAIKILNENAEEIKIICLNRGKNIDIAKKEFTGFEVIPIGKHRGNFLSIVFEANILRFFKIMKYCLANKCDIGISVGGFLFGFVLRIISIPNLQFCDDPENKKSLFFQKLTATALFYPDFYTNHNLINFKALKEWSYLSPKYFIPNEKHLEIYGLKKHKYIFIREVSSKTTNYKGQKSNMIALISTKFPNGYQMVLSLEDKSTAALYPESWILLNEPLEDIHSLIYFSKILISSGDSMAREGAMLGVPSIYCGIRDMAANKVMIDKGMLFHKDVENVPQFVEQIINRDIKIEEQDKFRERLKDEWIDVTEFIIRQIKKYG